VEDFSVDSARRAERRGRLDAWVAAFLRSPGSDNAALADQLIMSRSSWCGPLRLPFADLQRLAGPPDQPTLTRLGDDDLETVEDMRDSIGEGWEVPPLIVSYRDSELSVEDGNHRIESLRRTGLADYWAVVGFDDAEQRRAFCVERGILNSTELTAASRAQPSKEVR
jgi:hypothetical protein